MARASDVETRAVLGQYGLENASVKVLNDLVQSFCSAYSVVRRTKLEPSHLAAFRIAGCVVYLEWLFTNPNERVRLEKWRWVPRTLALMREAHGKHA